MSRMSPYTMALLADERAELEARGRTYTLPYREVVRVKLVLYAAQGAEQRRDRAGRPTLANS